MNGRIHDLMVYVINGMNSPYAIKSPVQDQTLNFGLYKIKLEKLVEVYRCCPCLRKLVVCG
jgi:hypothetical protein